VNRLHHFEGFLHRPDDADEACAATYSARSGIRWQFPRRAANGHCNTNALRREPDASRLDNYSGYGPSTLSGKLLLDPRRPNGD
jgi:hypothetical protein